MLLGSSGDKSVDLYDKNMPEYVKVKIYRTVARPVPIYGTEYCSMMNEHVQALPSYYGD